jgi:hypothetical protein
LPLPNNAIDKVNWETISLEVGKSAMECKIHYTNRLSPTICRDSWSEQELKRLGELAQEHHYRNWSLVASALGTQRLPWQVFQAYKTFIEPKSKQIKWTAVEDRKLMEAVEKVGTKSWSRVAAFMPKRSPSQCMHRYLYSINPKKTRGRWSKEEDTLLLQGIQEYGRGNWTLISRKYVPNRTDAQVRERYENVLNPDIEKGPWTDDEVDKLKKAVQELGTGKWAAVARSLGSRTDNQCKRMWSHISKGE